MTVWMKRLAIVLSLVVVLLPVMARADVVAYSAPGDKHLFIESAPQLAPKNYIVKFTGLDSPWAGKVIRVVKTTTPSGDRYEFTYDVNLSTGTIKRTYQIVVDSEPTMAEGTIVPTVELYYSGGPRDGTVFTLDNNLTHGSQTIGLAQQYLASPYVPAMQ